MRSLRYLNGVLTVIAVLLTLQLWTTWSTGSTTLPGASVAEAKTTRSQTAARRSGIPDAGGQRAEMVKLLKQSNQKTDALIALFRSGQARVRVEGDVGGDNKRTK